MAHSAIPAFFRHSGFFFRHSGFFPSFLLFFRHSGESRNPSFSCDLGIAKEREAPPSAIPAQAGIQRNIERGTRTLGVAIVARTAAFIDVA